MSIEEETLKIILSGVYNNSFFHEDGMTFEQAMAQMREGKRVTRSKYREHTYFTIGEDEDYDHRFPCLLKHVLASKPNEPERWRAYIVSHVTVHDIFAEDWEVHDG